MDDRLPSWSSMGMDELLKGIGPLSPSIPLAIELPPILEGTEGYAATPAGPQPELPPIQDGAEGKDATPAGPQPELPPVEEAATSARDVLPRSPSRTNTATAGPASDDAVNGTTKRAKKLRYVCKRCGWGSPDVRGLFNHLKRRSPCPAVHSNASMKEMLDEFCASESKALKYRLSLSEPEDQPPQPPQPPRPAKRMRTSSETTPAATVSPELVEAFCAFARKLVSVNLFPHGFEQVAHIRREDVRRLWHAPAACVQDVVRNIYSNYNFPENATVRAIDGDAKHMMVHRGGGRWVMRDKDDVIAAMIDKALAVIEIVTEDDDVPDDARSFFDDLGCGSQSAKHAAMCADVDVMLAAMIPGTDTR